MFHQWLGISLINYLNTLRVNIACGYLENTTLPVTEIAERCGFTSLSNFYHVFHLINGIAPNKYRKKPPEHFPAKNYSIRILWTSTNSNISGNCRIKRGFADLK